MIIILSQLSDVVVVEAGAEHGKRRTRVFQDQARFLNFYVVFIVGHLDYKIEIYLVLRSLQDPNLIFIACIACII